MTITVKQPFTQRSPLRELCKRYARGQLEREKFLAARTQLLDQLAGVDRDEDADVITAPVRADASADHSDAMVTQDTDITDPQWSDRKDSDVWPAPSAEADGAKASSESILQKPQIAESGTSNKKRLMGVVAAIGVTGILGAAVYFFATRSDKNEITAPGVSLQSRETSAISTSDEAPLFDATLNLFEHAPFNSNSVDLLLQQWQTLDENQKLSARSTPSFISFKQALISRRDSLLAISHPDSATTEAIVLLARIAKTMALADLQKGLNDQMDSVPASAVTNVEGTHLIKAGEPSSGTRDATIPPAQKTLEKIETDNTSMKNSQSSRIAVSAKQSVAAEDNSASRLSSQSTVNRDGGGCSIDQLKSRKRTCHDVLISGGDAPELVVIMPGVLVSDGGAISQSKHQVEIKAFAIGRNEITAAEYAKYCQSENVACPKSEWGDGYPVVNVSWQDANNYLRWLSTKTGIHYRLPTEAEWEYVARAGTNSPFPWPGENSERPNPSEVIYNTTKPVDVAENYKSINPNSWKVFHMQGNVREWVQDNLSTSINIDAQCIARGGHYQNTRLDQVDAAARLVLPATNRDKFTGFRAARDL